MTKIEYCGSQPSSEFDAAEIPSWWNTHGSSMRLVAPSEKGYDPNKVVIKDTAATLTIEKNSKPDGDPWLLQWKIVYHRDAYIKGQITMSTKDILEAFGISTKNRFVAIRGGLYHRWQDYLNIPCAGSGRNGDPNISIEVDEYMQAAIRLFVAGKSR